MKRVDVVVLALAFAVELLRWRKRRRAALGTTTTSGTWREPSDLANGSRTTGPGPLLSRFRDE